MATSFDEGDPLELLMAEWSQLAIWFWALIAGGALCLSMLPDGPLRALGWFLMASAFGLPLLKLGHTIVIVGNELRKNAPRDPAESPSDPERT